MPEGMQGLLVTVGVLSSCIVFLSRQVAEIYKRRKNGLPAIPSYSDGDVGSQIADLHRWHKPIQDPDTCQPRFHWYENNMELKKELEANRESMDSLRQCMCHTSEAIDKLTAATNKSNGD